MVDAATQGVPSFLSTGRLGKYYDDYLTEDNYPPFGPTRFGRETMYPYFIIALVVMFLNLLTVVNFVDNYKTLPAHLPPILQIAMLIVVYFILCYTTYYAVMLQTSSLAAKVGFFFFLIFDYLGNIMLYNHLLYDYAAVFFFYQLLAAMVLVYASWPHFLALTSILVLWPAYRFIYAVTLMGVADGSVKA
jgi:hypothetical protein